MENWVEKLGNYTDIWHVGNVILVSFVMMNALKHNGSQVVHEHSSYRYSGVDEIRTKCGKSRE